MADESKVMQFSVVDNPAPRIPDYTENLNSKSYVPWGVDNNFPVFLNGLYKGSATLRAIIDGTVKFICGNGISVSDEAAKWKDEINRRGDTLEDLVESTGTDLLKYRGFAIQVIYNKLGEIKELYSLDFGRIRLSADGKKVYYAKKWGQWTSKYDVYDAFDRSKIDPNNPTQIYVFKSGARTCYPMPRYEGAFLDCLAEQAASKYVLGNLSNGLAARTVITLPNHSGLLTEDDKRAVEESIRSRFCGPDAEKRFFIFWQNEAEENIDIKPIQVVDESTKFNSIRAAARENIFVSMAAQPCLFGLPNKNNGFTQQEFAECFALYQRTQVQGYQKQIERALEKILNAKGAITILPFKIESEDE